MRRILLAAFVTLTALAVEAAAQSPAVVVPPPPVVQPQPALILPPPPITIVQPPAVYYLPAAPVDVRVRQYNEGCLPRRETVISTPGYHERRKEGMLFEKRSIDTATPWGWERRTTFSLFGLPSIVTGCSSELHYQVLPPVVVPSP